MKDKPAILGFMKPEVRALSIRQPWAWLIVNGFKDIENRDWFTRFRGRILVHAAKGMTLDEYAIAQVMAEENGVTLPEFDELERGGIVGEVDITDCVLESDSPWFHGDNGFVLKNAKPLPFIPCKGKLGFFKPSAEVQNTLTNMRFPVCSRWMDPDGDVITVTGYYETSPGHWRLCYDGPDTGSSGIMGENWAQMLKRLD